MALSHFLLISGWVLGSILELRGDQNSENDLSVSVSLSGGPLDRFGTTFGIILETLWVHVELFFGVFFEDVPCCF